MFVKCENVKMVEYRMRGALSRLAGQQAESTAIEQKAIDEQAVESLKVAQQAQHIAQIEATEAHEAEVKAQSDHLDAELEVLSANQVR